MTYPTQRDTLSRVAPWSQFLNLSWPPQLRFFESRTQLLRAFETDGCLAGFRWGDGVIAAQLDQSALLQVTAFGVQVMLATPAGDRDLGVRALTQTLATIEPSAISVGEMTFQYLLPLAGPYDAARAESASRLLQAALPGRSATDWALLVDGVSERLTAKYQVEFGVLSAEEAGPRLARRVGRMGSQQGFSPMGGDFWRLDEVPSVALFMDYKWWPTGNVGSVEGVEGVVQVWDDFAEETERMATTIYHELEEPEHEGVSL